MLPQPAISSRAVGLFHPSQFIDSRISTSQCTSGNRLLHIEQQPIPRFWVQLLRGGNAPNPVLFASNPVIPFRTMATYETGIAVVFRVSGSLFQLHGDGVAASPTRRW
jgi:hypothetical protein